MLFWKVFCKYSWRKVSFLFGLLIVLFLNVFFVLSCASARGLDLLYELSRDNYRSLDVFLLTMTLLGLLQFVSLLLLQLSDPGYVPKKQFID